MSEIDVARLAKLEAIVERGSKTVLDVAAALAEIREGRLYKATHGSFAEYVEERFGFGRRWASMLIKRTRPAELPPASGSEAVQEGDVEGWDVQEQEPEVLDVHPPRSPIDDASDAFNDVLLMVRNLATKVVALADQHGHFLARDSIDSLLTNLRSEIVWGQPSKACPHEPFDSKHWTSCQCRGSMWLPRSQTQEGKARARRASRNPV